MVTKTFPKNLIILGPQGSGKGTQARLLAEKFGYVHLGAGDILREMAKQSSKLGQRIHETINVEGRLVEPELVAQAIKEKIQSLPQDQGIIIEGFPRTDKQYGLMNQFLSKLGRGDYKVLFVELSQEEAVKRLALRLTCQQCGEIYIAGQAQQCSKCGGKLIQREDDKEAAVRTRFKLFNSETLPVVEQMEKEGKVIRINGAPSIEEVHEEVLSKLSLRGAK